MPLIKYEINLILTWSEKCVLTSKATRDAFPAQGGYPAVAAVDNPANATSKITDTKLYISVVTLSTEDDNNFLAQLKSGFKRTIKWNKYRSEMTNQTKTNNLNYLIDPTFNKVNQLFVLSFENGEHRTSFSKHYTPKVEIKDFNVLVDGNFFFDVPVKNKEEAYEKNIEISKNNDYTAGNLLDYEYFSKHYELIAIDLIKQIECHRQSKNKYKQGDTIKFETETIKSSRCDYSDVFTLVTGNIAVTTNNDTDVAFKNCAPFSTGKTIICLLTKQIIFTLQCPCTQ